MPPWPAAPTNVVDLAVLLILFFYLLNGYAVGWLVGVVELAGLGLALFIGLRFYPQVSSLLVEWTPLPYGLAKPAGFLLLWAISDSLYGILIRRLGNPRFWQAGRSPIGRVLGVWPGLARGLLVSAVLLSVAATIPFDERMQAALRESRFSQQLQPRAAQLDRQLGEVFGDAAQETIGLLTVRPQSDERVSLRFSVADPAFDLAAEAIMLNLVNRERLEHGLGPLRPDPTLREIARSHSRDMLQRGYFAHVGLDGDTPVDRMRFGGARFQAAGENLALAPTVELAHNGLMNSPGHRANILNGSFGRVGIGIADGGLHGKMVTQTFAD